MQFVNDVGLISSCDDDNKRFATTNSIYDHFQFSTTFSRIWMNFTIFLPHQHAQQENLSTGCDKGADMQHVLYLG